MDIHQEFFGTESSIALMKRSAALWSLIKDDPRFAYYGRTVALSDIQTDTADILASVASLLGASVAYYFPKFKADKLFAELKARGFSCDRHEHYWGGEAAYEASRQALDKYDLPSDLSIVALDKMSPNELVADVAALCQSCDVMPVPGAIMRGQGRRGINLVAIDASGAPIASASSFVMHHASGARPNDVFWGMLATREDRRGEKIGLILGAKAIIHMWEKEAARGFMTGVRLDNPSSQALCDKLGVTDSDWIYASCINNEVLGRASVTK
ncbi:hypothetical protein [Thalassospira profundimaris]|uniref:hypothetical protein n=1 Tax=Thalassospira profundimaris TaxID=502049 RepID=UPI000287190F|nr:hypothetical protein [Thalassospira profundimaris]EKF08172.1 hypothetical protein TH2_11729 [Thalassospira profundimaris WP0211]